MSQLADALNRIAQHLHDAANVNGFDLVPGRPATDEEMKAKEDAKRKLRSEIAALAEQAKKRRVQRPEVEALTARLAQLGAFPSMDMSLALVDALAADAEP